MNTIAMITARSTSRRFPRKHLADLGGKPMIVQIIDKLLRVGGLDYIVLATTDNKTDDDLASVAIESGAYVHRGSEDNLVTRHTNAITEFNADKILDISGDCPFSDIRILQKIVDSMLDWPEYDCYGISGPYAVTPGLAAGGHSSSWYEKAILLYHEHTEEFSADQYWLACKYHPERFSTYIADDSGIINKFITPMKMSIDWRVELDFFNRLIKHLGYYPETIDDFNKAFTELGVMND